MTNNIIFYGTPAFGHIAPTLHIVKTLVKNGYTVYYYSTKDFENTITKTGAIFKEYQLGDITFDLQIGSQLLQLYSLLLRFSYEQCDILIKEAEKIKPCLIMHDTVALWGRITAININISAVSVNTFPVVFKIFSKATAMYTFRFAGSTLTELKALPQIKKYKNLIRKKCSVKKLGMIDSIMNKEKLNIITFPRVMQAGGDKFGDDCFFLGASAILQENGFGSKHFDYPKDNLIYISLGTIFNDNIDFYYEIFSQFKNTKYNIVIACGGMYEKLKMENTPSNFIIKKSVDQMEVLNNAKLFICAGGMNSVCQAISKKVPCLICPQQGEQMITAKYVKKLGLGQIVENYKNIKTAGESLIKRYNPDESLIKEFTDIKTEECLNLIIQYINEERKTI